MTTVTPEIRGEAFLKLADRQKAGEIIMEIVQIVKPAGYIVQYRDVPQVSVVPTVQEPEMPW